MAYHQDLPIPKRLVAINADITQALSTPPEGVEYRNPIKTDQDEADVAMLIFNAFTGANKDQMACFGMLSNQLKKWQIQEGDGTEDPLVKNLADNIGKLIRMYVSDIEDDRLEFFHISEEKCLSRTLQEQVVLINNLVAIYRDDSSLPTAVLLAAKVLRFGFYYVKRVGPSQS